MKINQCALVVVGLLFASGSQSIVKCTGDGGAVVFQDAPCSSASRSEVMMVKPASGRGMPPAAPLTGASAAAPRPLTEVEKIDQQVASSQRSRRLRELRETYIPSAESRINMHKAQCAAKLEKLSASQFAYVQNLYGKTHAAMVASEKAALLTTCQSEEVQDKEDLDKLVKERDLLVQQQGK